MSGHGLDHEGYDAVVDCGDGLFLRLAPDGKVNIAKYRASDAHKGEQPEWERTLERVQWAEAVVILTTLPADTPAPAQGSASA
jgi:hypothetical protein